jgi:predicted adenylyl cyclase CyaB
MTRLGGCVHQPPRGGSDSRRPALIERLQGLPPDRVHDLLVDSEAAGSRIVRRAVDQWADGTNRFDRPGEALFAASLAGRLVGVCGLNVDPYAGDDRVGRVRHLYVLTSCRRRGVGRQLVAHVIDSAGDRFDSLPPWASGRTRPRASSRTSSSSSPGLVESDDRDIRVTTAPGSNHEARNVEIKARIASVEALTSSVAALADQGPIEIEQDDTFFLCARGRIKLRAFSATEGQLIFYRRANQAGPKESRFVISPTGSPDSLRDALALAYGTAGRVRKHRTLYLVGRTRVHLDRVEGLGEFLELEVVLAEGETWDAGAKEARALMTALGLSDDQLVEGAYVDLLHRDAENRR